MRHAPKAIKLVAAGRTYREAAQEVRLRKNTVARIVKRSREQSGQGAPGGESRAEAALIHPGKSWRNGMVERLNGKFRNECLSMNWPRSRLEAKVVIEDWRRTYKEEPAFRFRQNDAEGHCTDAQQQRKPRSHLHVN